MNFSFVFWLCLFWQITCSSDIGSIPEAPSTASEFALKQEPRVADSIQRKDTDSNDSRVWRLDAPGKFVDAVFKSSPAVSGSEIALVRELQQDEHIPGLSRDYHPDHRPVSHHQLYVQSGCGSPKSRRAIGPPIEGCCRHGHTYYMATAAGDYILSSSLVFSEPNSVIQIFITWTSFQLRHEISRLSYNFENDCKAHHIAVGGFNFVTSLPYYDCPWVSAVPNPTGTLIASLHHSASSTDPYELDVEILIAAPGYTPAIFKTKLDFYKVQFEAAMYYHWTDHNIFRMYGGSSAFEINVYPNTSGVPSTVVPIPFNRAVRKLPKTSSCRVAQHGETVLVLDRDDEFEPKEISNTLDKPFGVPLH